MSALRSRDLLAPGRCSALKIAHPRFSEVPYTFGIAASSLVMSASTAVPFWRP